MQITLPVWPTQGPSRASWGTCGRFAVSSPRSIAKASIAQRLVRQYREPVGKVACRPLLIQYCRLSDLLGPSARVSIVFFLFSFSFFSVQRVRPFLRPARLNRRRFSGCQSVVHLGKHGTRPRQQVRLLQRGRPATLNTRRPGPFSVNPAAHRDCRYDQERFGSVKSGHLLLAEAADRVSWRAFRRSGANCWNGGCEHRKGARDPAWAKTTSI